MRGVNTTKLLILAILGFCAVVLGSAVLTLQLYVTQEKRRLGVLGRYVKRDRGVEDSRTIIDAVTTIKPSQPIASNDIHLNHNSPPNSRNYQTIQQAYWRQAATSLQQWDALLQSSFGEDDDGRHTDESPLLIPTAEVNAFWALEQAVHAGHPMAQHYWANAHASGIWPIHDDSAHSLHVFEEWSPADIGDHPQLSQALVLWHMAAIGGNIESAMAMAHRMAELGVEKEDDKICRDVLPYLEAAAHGIIDQLEASPHSRAKILPPMDQHMLAQVHMHGGTSSQLDWNNKPYQSKELIQFYHLKATTTPWSSRLTQSSTDEPPVDVHAASTLAQMYHYGYQGVPQNLTKSLMYYEIAASHGHWESAGEAGTFFLWGIGTKQNAIKAWEMFTIGAPFDLEGCQRRREKALSSKDDVIECDPACLNGLGVIHLLGIPNKIKVDLLLAEKYFTLAKEMGNADAMYNLSMMWLGWKTHFKHVEDLERDGMSSLDTAQAFPHSDKKQYTFALHYSERTKQHHKGPVETEVQEAFKLLSTAATKGHLQAKHRLAMMYSEGVTIQAQAMKYETIKPNCEKARSHYQWIVDHASLDLSKRLRKAYKAYIGGDWEVSLRNYLAAAETGSSVGQVNAAFLLEQGICLGLSTTDCAKASVRLWKAAAARRSIEAHLRVGDFYYYGRLRGRSVPVGPFGWVRYILYPEKYLPELISMFTTKVGNMIQNFLQTPSNDQETLTEEEQQRIAEKLLHERELLEADLSTAAHYYTDAVEKFQSPRANFNLGFMYEWGLGLKQDFPLAKRHYDLAMSMNNQKREAEVAVQIALWALSVHEYFVKLLHSWDDRYPRKQDGNSDDTEAPSKTSASSKVGQPNPASATRFIKKTSQEIILSHLLNWSSLVILILFYIVVRLQKMREDRRRRR